MLGCKSEVLRGFAQIRQVGRRGDRQRAVPSDDAGIFRSRDRDYLHAGATVRQSTLADCCVSQWASYLIKFLIATCLTAINLTGLEVVGAASMVVLVLVLVPFLLLGMVGLDNFQPEAWISRYEAAAASWSHRCVTARRTCIGRRSYTT